MKKILISLFLGVLLGLAISWYEDRYGDIFYQYEARCISFTGDQCD